MKCRRGNRRETVSDGTENRVGCCRSATPERASTIMNSIVSAPNIAIACGGTGGHLFPGLAVAEKLVERGCAVTLLISPKEVDQEAVKSAWGMEVVTLPAVALQRGSTMAFVRGFKRSFGASRRLFSAKRPQAALAMGGFTSAPPILAARSCGTPTFLHESNTVAGRANRWLSWVVRQAFVGFPSAAARLRNRSVTLTGTPVRPSFKAADPEVCRAELGFDPKRPVVLVVGGSQGASGLNDLVLRALPILARSGACLQWLHLAGPNDVEKVSQGYETARLDAVVHAFFDRMELALGAATAAISRAGASSLAELAAMRVPAVLVPYPHATDNHQVHNAEAFVNTGAARMLQQKLATPDLLARMVLELVEQPAMRERMQAALGRWQSPRAAEQIAEAILGNVEAGRAVRRPLKGASPWLLADGQGTARPTSAMTSLSHLYGKD
jgi:UDP-N-acetylglucosamine--N-acetylmuramyl-(pentapeptide) pyrophosphoryl-undecaprenol N-acetylglucosamine transferase